MKIKIVSKWYCLMLFFSFRSKNLIDFQNQIFHCVDSAKLSTLITYPIVSQNLGHVISEHCTFFRCFRHAFFSFTGRQYLMIFIKNTKFCSLCIDSKLSYNREPNLRHIINVHSIVYYIYHISRWLTIN